MLKIAVLVSGGGTNLQAVIDRIKDGGITNAELSLVISNNPEAYALSRARKHGINAECISPRNFPERSAFNQALLACLNAHAIDLVVLAGYLVIVPKEVIQAYKNRIVNIHPSLIPSFCGSGFYGLRVHEAAIARGVKVSGATVHFVDEGTDTGSIIRQRPVVVLPEDTPETLQQRIMEEAEWVILPQAIDDIANQRIYVDETQKVRWVTQTEESI